MTGNKGCLPVPENLDPHKMQYLMAKSLDRSCDHTRQETLVEHTWHVCERLAELYKANQNLQTVMSYNQFWDAIFWAAFLHDFGKAAHDFQKIINGTSSSDNPWKGHRHEVLSLGFVDWVFPKGINDDMRNLVLGVVASHHRDLLPSSGMLPQYAILSHYKHQHRIEYLASQVDTQAVQALYEWLHQFAFKWRDYFQFPKFIEYLPNNGATFGYENIKNALSDLNDYIIEIEFDNLTKIQSMLSRGLILSADHAASAGTGTIPTLTLNDAYPLHGFSPHPHQTQAAKTIGNALLIAPTGSGKTEAALAWVAQQMQAQSATRLFYTLPYQASMNAMKTRLSQTEMFNHEQVTVRHSRALLQYYNEHMNADGGAADTAKAIQAARDQKNRADLNYYAVSVFSPYQMLKAAFALKGYEALLVDYTGALFIFDEIHAYEVKRLAQIIATMHWLRDQFHARFFVMTATLPPILQDKLCDALQIEPENIIQADTSTFESSRRHRVELVENVDMVNGDVVQRTLADYHDGRRVLIVCNQVKRAQAIFSQLQPYIIEESNLIMLHGRFTLKDRQAIEEQILARAGVGVDPMMRQPLIVVATQTVEVSLNVDFDRLYTDPAPLEALLQRFGRVNRGRAQYQAQTVPNHFEFGILPVTVYGKPDDEKGIKPYDVGLVQRALEQLRQLNHGEIDEGRVNAMLAQVYSGDILAEWEGAYRTAYHAFLSQLNNITPYQSADSALKTDFYAMFEGVQVLPHEYHNEYLDYIEARNYIEANRLLVSGPLWWRSPSISKEDNDVYVTLEQTTRYDPKLGLQLISNVNEDGDDDV